MLDLRTLGTTLVIPVHRAVTIGVTPSRRGDGEAPFDHGRRADQGAPGARAAGSLDRDVLSDAARGVVGVPHRPAQGGGVRAAAAYGARYRVRSGGRARRCRGVCDLVVSRVVQVHCAIVDTGDTLTREIAAADGTREVVEIIAASVESQSAGRAGGDVGLRGHPPDHSARSD